MSVVGHSCGILLGERFDVFDFTSFDASVYFASVVLHHRAIDKTWEVVGVYGLTNKCLSHEFLLELSAKVDTSTFPLLIGGDFNLLRFPWDKNNSNF